MRKFGMAVLVACVFGGHLYGAALKSRVGLWGSYGSVSMDEMNEQIAGISEAILGLEAPKISKIGAIGIEGGIATSENVILGVRLGGMKTQVATVSMDVPLIGSGKMEAWAQSNVFLAGFRYMIPIDDNLNAGFGGLVGEPSYQPT